MEIASFVAVTLAGAILENVAADAYVTTKNRLLTAFGMKTSMEALEASPDDEDVRQLVEKKLANSGATSDEVILEGIQKIAEELEKLPADTPLGASMTVSKLRAEAAEFRRNQIRGHGQMRVEDIVLSGKLIVEDNIVGDD